MLENNRISDLVRDYGNLLHAAGIESDKDEMERKFRQAYALLDRIDYLLEVRCGENRQVQQTMF